MIAWLHEDLAPTPDRDDEAAVQARQVLLDEGFSEGDIEWLVRHEVAREDAEQVALTPSVLRAAVLMAAARRAIAGDHATVRLMIARARDAAL
jgi:hypothetical protein